MASSENERRASRRLKIAVPIELCTEEGDSPIRGATSDLSLSGCYIETLFPFPAGTKLEITLRLESTIVVTATAVTCDPQVGNGIRFNRMLPEDFEELRGFLEAADKKE